MSAKIIPFKLNFHQQPLEQVGAKGLLPIPPEPESPPTSAPQTYSQSSGLEALATEAGEQ